MPEYKGITYELRLPSPLAREWEWVVHLDGAVMRGKSSLRYSAENNAKRAIDKALRMNENLWTTEKNSNLHR